jgi:hypothetical protein
MKIRKSTGELATFDPSKIRESLLRTGATNDLVEHVIARTKNRMTDGMSTKRLFTIVRQELRKENRCIAHRYNLRHALLKLGPSGFKFEKYVASVLRAYLYDAAVPEKDQHGLCVDHEVDVIATKDGKTALIEAKFRNRFGDNVKLKDTMATWARYQDLRDGYEADGRCPKFDEVWIVTNGKFSDRSMQYGVCKGIHLVGWSEDQHSLAALVDHSTMYPITVLDDVRQWELDRFAQKDLMLCREIAQIDIGKLSAKVEIPRDRIEKIVNDCKEVVDLDGK